MDSKKGAVQRLLATSRQRLGGFAGSLLTLYLTVRPDRKGGERARRSAEVLIAACRAFQARHGRLPSALEELVPGFLPELPRAKFDGPHFGFTYETSEQDGEAPRHVLGWTEVLPFGRPYYVFEEDRWGYLD